jgi:hypothetical protein
LRGGSKWLGQTYDSFRLACGFRIGETHDEIRKRIDEIVDLEAALDVADIKNTDAELIKRRCVS